MEHSPVVGSNTDVVAESSDASSKPLFLDYALELPEDIQLASSRKGVQMAESIRYDGNQSKSVDD